MTTETDTLIARLRDSAGIKSLDKWIRDEFEAAADALAQRDAEIARLRSEVATLVALADDLENQLDGSWCGCGV